MNTNTPHRRFNPLTGASVTVSPQRNLRPWQGSVEASDNSPRPPYDSECYLCPGNTRASGNINADYQGTWIFDNDFPALLPDAVTNSNPSVMDESPLLRREAISGICRVICFSERHDLTLAEMSATEIATVVSSWRSQYLELAEHWRWVQIFENKGAIMGCSNPHPHGQIWASQHLPSEPALVDRHQRDWYEKHGTVMLLDYAGTELRQQERIVEENEHWLVVVPYWAAWPFETLLMPKIHKRHMGELDQHEMTTLAHILKRLLTRYDNLFQTSFPYSMGWHQSPGLQPDNAHWQLHAHFYPPLLRSASVRKFMVGYEMVAESQRDITPESACQLLLGVSAVHHYRQGTAS
ncbi:MAG: UDP-glucose--hexose-1-phosphate uridylyltransferase [Pseudomonadales bacterium]|nr:UDP-glucose--hexose-1-phosphate uridylyltransferase [Pseudomonadales bacterium]